MSLQELIDYCDPHPEHQEEIRANVWEWWNMELDEMIDKASSPVNNRITESKFVRKTQELLRSKASRDSRS